LKKLAGVIARLAVVSPLITTFGHGRYEIIQNVQGKQCFRVTPLIAG